MERLKEIFLPPDPKELVRKWQATLRTEQRSLERQIRDIQFEEKKVKKSIKDAAKRGDMKTAKMMAKEILQSRKAIGRIATNKAQLMSINNALIEQLAMLRVAKTLSRSTEVMKMVNTAMKLPEMQKTMVEMSKEMMKAGLIDEMMNDAIDSALDGEDIEEETEEQLNQVIDEIVGDTLAAMPAARRNQPQAARAKAQQQEEEEEEGEMAELHQRLEAAKT